MIPTSRRFIVLFSTLALTAPLYASERVDQDLPHYKSVGGLSGNISSVGSDTLANLMTLWAEQFNRIYPGVNIQIQAAGSSTAPTALNLGTSNLGPMSRLMKDGEIEAFETSHGYKPMAIAIAIDALAIFVHQDNPIESLTLVELDAIFSSTRNCGSATTIVNWGQLGLQGSWASRDLQLFGRNSVSGTYGYFKQHVLCNGDFRNNVNEQPGSASVVQSVSTSLNGIGYSGLGYATASVRSVPIASDMTSEPVEATRENVANGTYPLARYLYIYVNKAPGKRLDPVSTQFLNLILSLEGQNTVLKAGHIPLPASVASKELSALQ